uniref:Putative retrotransposon protein n=1 Tax=Phyllostachys edulis TaxID=38705 RepID=D3IVE2_PHYED|nr:putative retrotransposon protein [Phyllostachys edulis]
MADRYATAAEADEWNKTIDGDDKNPQEADKSSKKKDKKAKKIQEQGEGPKTSSQQFKGGLHRRFPIVVQPTINNCRVNRVSVDGSSSLNILFTSALDEMQVPRTKMLGPKGVITIYCDKKMAHTCDRRSLEMVGQIPTREENKEQPLTKQLKPKVAPKPNDQVKEVPLDPEEPSKTIRIGDTSDPK